MSVSDDWRNKESKESVRIRIQATDKRNFKVDLEDSSGLQASWTRQVSDKTGVRKPFGNLHILFCGRNNQLKISQENE